MTMTRPKITYVKVKRKPKPPKNAIQIPERTIPMPNTIQLPTINELSEDQRVMWRDFSEAKIWSSNECLMIQLPYPTHDDVQLLTTPECSNIHYDEAAKCYVLPNAPLPVYRVLLASLYGKVSVITQTAETHVAPVPPAHKPAPKRNWQHSKKGSLWARSQGDVLAIVFPDQYGRGYRYSIDGEFKPGTFRDVNECMKAASVDLMEFVREMKG